MKKKASSSGEWLTAILVALSMAIIIRMFFFAPYEVHGESMYPTFEGQELLIVNKWIYDVSKPGYGDIVVFHTVEQKDFIKRVIGLPGDIISVKGGHVYRNGKKLDEPYINGPIKGVVEAKKVPPNHLFVMGDNRNRSRDSREIGPVSMGEVVGRADVVVMPIREFQLLFR
ncbi:signal peptidase I [Marinithermofilum abyssi]|uniref:Signal peptidase I n=1 Tax=Marinithermofilum abyssi TaxID=1571185 RepID=A0A8J2VIG0_9BACL|nr:signal peptidase I [Marinithermofilum abyssi]GGE21967.1 signal peptidase I [Marinithermofilum abyssi]